MTFNSRSLCNKTVGVTEFLNEHNCDVCLITEAWLKVKDTSTVAELKELGYNVTFQPRKGRRGGGVCVLFKKHIALKKCNIKQYKTFEVLENTIKSQNDLLRISTLYRTGKMSTEGRKLFTNDLDDYLQRLMLKKGEKLLCGDFNIHVENENDLDRLALYTVTESYGFMQLVKGPTHTDGGTLDLVFIQKESHQRPTIEKSLLIHDIAFSLTSDHCFIDFNVPFVSDKLPDKNVHLSYRDYSKVDIDSFTSDMIKILQETSSDFFNEDVDSAVLLLNEALIQAIDKHAPVINASVKERKTCYSNSSILALRRKRRKAERMLRKYRNPEDRRNYKLLEREVKKLVKASMNEYVDEKVNAANNNTKAKFKIFNKILGKQQEKLLPAYEQEEELCQEFETFFCNKIENIRSKIINNSANSDTSSPSHDALPLTESFSNFQLLTDEQVVEVVQKLPDKYCTLDPVSSAFFKKCLNALLPYVKYILNTSLGNGVFPSLYKQTLVKPKLKCNSLDQDVLKNYRPLSNLSFLSKALERCVLKQLVHHLDSNNLFGDFQSAYRKFHSCETAITKITNDILMSLDKKQCSFLLFLDLSAAFDTVDHSILLNTLMKKYNIRNSVLEWIKSYLTDRNYKVNINKAFSKGVFLLFGVPQGSILGPILFILYISEIENIARCHGFRIHVYADDTQLYISFEKCSVLSVVSEVEHCLREIKAWMANNFLKLNEDKTNFMVISSNNDLRHMYTDLCISFSGNVICPSLDAVNLGVTFDSAMTMKTYINNIVSKGYGQLSNFWKAASKLNVSNKLQLVSCFILPLIDYCNITFLAASKEHTGKLQKLLNSAIRFIFNLSGKRYRLSITPYMKKLHILPVEYRVKYKVSLLVFKCFHNIAPTYLQELILPRISYSHLRSSDDVFSLQTDVPNTHFGESAFSYSAPITWNALPLEVKSSPTLECFKKRLKTHYFIKYYGCNN